MTWREFEKLARKQGFQFVKHGGRHDEYYNPQTNVTIQIERHWSEEMKKGISARLLKAIGL